MYDNFKGKEVSAESEKKMHLTIKKINVQKQLLSKIMKHNKSYFALLIAEDF